MKKTNKNIIRSLLLLSSVMLVGCGETPTSQTSQYVPPISESSEDKTSEKEKSDKVIEESEEIKDPIALLNSLKNKDYSYLYLTISYEDENYKLDSYYSVEKTSSGHRINYHYQEAAVYDIDNLELLQSSVINKQGVVELNKQGQITSKEGDELNISLSQIRVSNLNFDLGNINIEENTEEGGINKVKLHIFDAQSFSGINDALDMEALIYFNQDQISSVKLTYTYHEANIIAEFSINL